ncbi:hypothetical protein GcM3_106028 [Golovinomyces cichoracearum]|uniref:Uncharacterized protein n=1 Tax=Golovinomyces cichoracearum TaxID=62708 RepID=A0A420I9F7_9PEZI|nr:hypothetical protein GcM3_106028 [Golovinomyces cichoracearum]
MATPITPPLATSSSPHVSSRQASTYHHPVCTPDPLVMPRGKYYPSNYKYPVLTMMMPVLDQPARAPFKSSINSLRSNIRNSTKKERTKNHESRGSEAAKMLQQYQRDMITQARKEMRKRCLDSRISPPERILLQPIETGIDGITPFNLGEDEKGDCYITEGERRKLETQRLNSDLNRNDADEDEDELSYTTNNTLSLSLECGFSTH